MYKPYDNTNRLVSTEGSSCESESPRGMPVRRLAIITNHPPPFRIPVYEIIGTMPGVELLVIFCSRREPNRQWQVPPLRFNHVFLRERFVTRGDNFIHNNLDVVSALHRFGPDAIVTTGFNPTYLYAFGYALMKGIAHVPMTDGTDASEQALSAWHKRIRRFVYRRSQAFIAASAGGQRLYESYGIAPHRCFRSCLCIDNGEYLREAPQEEKKYDFIFCGRIVEGKNPLFALHVARDAARSMGRKVSILFVGSGSQEERVRKEAGLLADMVQAEFYGFAGQDELPALYRSARIFLFPTLADVWGVVANEAAAASLPIIVSPHAGVAGELVQHGDNGFVCELDAAQWSRHAALLLTQPAVYQRFAARSRALASQYTFEQAAAGLVSACRAALDIDRTEEYLKPANSVKGG
ncbi:glycosyltransferase family 4 protein [Noviherbaspirillum sp. UKPF54]|uniref:glycosyltransferase family 4 protein n=1 Tax=Noviherbaspirillum sp. UKPF54 TaxID=2601898 RepID=UPI001FF06FF4|nr:glycosyltransferase family 4 protein [Noviherbaspirillum sp. UKPF54]